MSNGSCDNCGTYVTWKRLCIKCLKAESGGESVEDRNTRHDAFF